jgi:hypothetical protein
MWRLLLLLASSTLVVVTASAKDDVYRQRGVLVEMQSVSCGFQQKTGSTVAGVLITGAQHTKSRELLCQEYILKTDRVTYRIRPKEEKHPVLLPVGDSAEFRLKKDKMLLRVPESDNKEREYLVVSMTPSEEFAAAINKTQHPPKPHVSSGEQPVAKERADGDGSDPGSTPPAASTVAQASGPSAPVQTAPAETGSVQVESSPAGAEIFVDSTSAGRTPTQITLRPGSHAIQVVMPGYKDWVQTINVAAGTQQRVAASLAK